MLSSIRHQNDSPLGCDNATPILPKTDAALRNFCALAQLAAGSRPISQGKPKSDVAKHLIFCLKSHLVFQQN